MHIKVSQATLYQQIHRCQNVVEKKSTNPILANIHFEVLEDTLKITATDLQSTYSSTQNVDVIEKGSFTVEAKKIFEIVRELHQEQPIDLKIKDSFLKISSGKITFKLATKPADEFPSEPDDETDLFINIPGNELSRMITSTSFAMSNDETRKYLTGSLFEVTSEHGMRIVTTDGHRMALSTFKLDDQEAHTTCIVPKKAVLEIKRLAEGVKDQLKLCLGKQQVRLEINQQKFISKVIDAKYPVYEDVIPNNNPYIATIDKSIFDQSLRRSMVVSNDFTHDVKLSFSLNLLSIAAFNSEQEQAEEEIVIEYNGLDIEIGFNAKYIRDILSSVQDQRICIQLKDSLSPAKLVEENNSSSCHVLMPMRI